MIEQYRAMKDGQETRSVVDKEDIKKDIKKIFKFRKIFYEFAAEIAIDTTDKSINAIVEEIINYF